MYFYKLICKITATNYFFFTFGIFLAYNYYLIELNVADIVKKLKLFNLFKLPIACTFFKNRI